MIGEAFILAAAIVIAACIVAVGEPACRRGGYQPGRGVLPPPPHGGSAVSEPSRPKR